MKYYALTESKNIKTGRMCPSLEMAFAVAIMINGENPEVAVECSDATVVNINPRTEEFIKLDGLMKAEMVRVSVDENNELTLSIPDFILPIEDSVILIHYKDDLYVRANIGLEIDKLIADVTPARIQHRQTQTGIKPFTKTTDVFTFEYISNIFKIEGKLSDVETKIDIDSRLVPDGKLVVLNAEPGNATMMKVIGKYSSVIKLYENSSIKYINFHYYWRDSIKPEFHEITHPKISTQQLI